MNAESLLIDVLEEAKINYNSDLLSSGSYANRIISCGLQKEMKQAGNIQTITVHVVCDGQIVYSEMITHQRTNYNDYVEYTETCNQLCTLMLADISRTGFYDLFNKRKVVYDGRFEGTEVED